MKIIFTILAGLILFSGCAGVRESSRIPVALGKDIKVYQTTDETLPVPQTSGNIDLDKALSQALLHNPELGAFAWEIRTAEARALQAKLISNPELEFEVDGIDDKGFDNIGLGVSLSKTFETGGKRCKRKQIANLETQATIWQYESTRLNVYANVKKAFTELSAMQERLSLSQEMLDLDREMLELISKRVELGRDSQIEETKAQIAVSQSEIELRQNQMDLQVAKNTLSNLWGETKPEFDGVVSQLETLESVPSFDELSGKISQNPDLAQWDNIIETLEKSLTLEKAGRIPDVSLGAGLSHSTVDNTSSYKLSMGFELPFFDRKQGDVLQASFSLEKAQKERLAAEIEVMAELSETHQSLVFAYEEALSLQDEIIPSAQKVFDGTNTGFQNGKYSYLEVLDAQKTLFELRTLLINAKTSYHSAKADLERLIAESLI